MKTTGKCPKCGSTEVYTNANLPPRGERALLAISGWGQAYIYNYICVNCGYLEEYIEKSNEKKLDKIKTEWTKVNPQQ